MPPITTPPLDEVAGLVELTAPGGGEVGCVGGAGVVIGGAFVVGLTHPPAGNAGSVQQPDMGQCDAPQMKVTDDLVSLKTSLLALA